MNILLQTDDEHFRSDFSNQVSRFTEQVTFVQDSPDVIIVDDDFEACRKWRKSYANIPIILLSSTAQNDSDERLNIVIKKPFSLMEVLDVLRAANHKLDNSEDGYLSFNGYELRPSNKEIIDTQSGKTIRLTEKEVGIIKFLYKMSNRYVSKNELQTNVWQYHEEVTTHTIETHIYRVRQKVETADGRRLILTENGGYKLNMGE